jgi:mannose-6-phosphate isomerase-like protein (cupin superfamily)
MKLAILSLCCLSLFCSAQHFPGVDKMEPEGSFENIQVKKLASDSLSSTFLIWVKHSVKAHYHKDHEESLYVLEGEGEMTLGNDTILIRPGDFVSIPMATVHSVEVRSKKPLKVISIQAPEFLGEDRIFVDPIRRPGYKKD